MTHFRRALALDPSLVEAQVNIGNILMLQGKQEEAAAQFARALEINSNFPDAHVNLGNVFQSQGRLTDERLHIRAGLQPIASRRRCGSINISASSFQPPISARLGNLSPTC
jgi:tetratricopeptide (TPR) repeat protein